MSSTGHGRAATAPRAGVDTGALRAAHATMALLREADEAAGALSRAGRCGVHVPAAGTEALVVAVAAALDAGDWVLPNIRLSGLALARGLRPESHFAQVLGRAGDPSRGRQSPGAGAVRALGVVTPSAPVGSQLVHAVGVARAMRSAAREEVALALAGHAAVATADFHVALNFAALWRVPCVFVIAGGEGLGEQTATETVAVKAGAYGLPATEVDGADFEAALAAVHEAVDRARRGGGPTLIDAACPSPPQVRPASGLHLVEETAEPGTAWGDADPLARVALRLPESAEDLARDREEARTAVEAAVAAALEQPDVPGDTLFSDVHARLTPALREQRDEWRVGRSPGS